jgi:outer membrane protein TolC
MGNSRSDFLSLGVSFDLPIFTANRQDKDVDAAVARANQTKTQRRLLLRQLLSAFETSRSQLLRLDERQALYATQLLPQMSEQSEASLSAYNNDYGDFAEAVRARIAELNAKIEMLSIQVERQKQIAQINYLLTDSRNTESGGDPALSGANNE